MLFLLTEGKNDAGSRDNVGIMLTRIADELVNSYE